MSPRQMPVRLDKIGGTANIQRSWLVALDQFLLQRGCIQTGCGGIARLYCDLLFNKELRLCTHTGPALQHFGRCMQCSLSSSAAGSASGTA